METIPDLVDHTQHAAQRNREALDKRVSPHHIPLNVPHYQPGSHLIFQPKKEASAMDSQDCPADVKLHLVLRMKMMMWVYWSILLKVRMQK